MAGLTAGVDGSHENLGTLTYTEFLINLGTLTYTEFLINLGTSTYTEKGDMNINRKFINKSGGFSLKMPFF